MDNKRDEAPKQPKQKTRTNWWRRLALVLLIYSAYSWFADPFRLEYYGYCKKDGVTRDPQALMDKYIETIVKEQAEAGDNYVKYSSVQDFYQQNPQCCRMYAWQSLQLYPWWFQRFSAVYARIFNLETYYQITLSYRSKTNDAKPYVYSDPVISVCGDVANGTGAGAQQGYYPSGAGFFRFLNGRLN